MKQGQIRKEIDYRRMSWKILEITVKSVFILAAAAMLSLGALKGYEFGYELFFSAPLDSQDISAVSAELTVENGEDAFDVGKKLEEAGIIKSAYVFWAQSRLFEISIQPGVYTVDSHMSPRVILSTMNKKG